MSRNIFEEPIDRVQTNASVMIPKELFEKLYLSPENAVKGELRKTFGNPTPMGLLGFLLSASPLACILMGWRGSGGFGAASIGSFYAFGSILMLMSTVMEWILGNTFTMVVFGFFGGFWLSLSMTLTPSLNALGAYTSGAKDAAQAAAGVAEFNASLAFVPLFMAVLTTMFVICALRTNVIFFYMFFLLVIVELLLSASYWVIAEGRGQTGQSLQVAAGAVMFAIVIPGWYLLFSQLLMSVDFPLSLPVGDLSEKVRGASTRKKSA